MELLVKIILKKPIEDDDITNAMYEVCDAVHASCNPECPVFAINNKIPMNENCTNCSCFKNGQAMIDYIRKNYKED